MTTTTAEPLALVTYFRINGGDTILEKRAEGWFRWDSRAGIVPTSIDWDSTPERLTQMSYEEAAPFIARANAVYLPTGLLAYKKKAHGKV